MYSLRDLPRLAAAVIGILTALAILGACDAASSPPAVSDAWVRPPLGADRPAAGYLTITGSGTADALTRATSPVATSVEIHQTMAEASGMTGMHPVERIDVGAGDHVRLEPGGYHLMLLGVTEPLDVGDTVELTLTFEDGGEVTVQAEVRAG